MAQPTLSISSLMMLLRILSIQLMAVWLGGFTFYSAVVVHIIHQELDSILTGSITQRVTDGLNIIGAVTWLAWALNHGLEPAFTSLRFGRLRLGLLVTTGCILLLLAWLHNIMDARLELGRLRGFYPLHRAYLIASTGQWAANVGLLTLAVLDWSRGPTQRASRSQSSSNDATLTTLRASDV